MSRGRAGALMLVLLAAGAPAAPRAQTRPAAMAAAVPTSAAQAGASEAPAAQVLELYAAHPAAGEPVPAVPGAPGRAEADDPRVDVYLPPSNPTRSAVLVVPGGGYQNVMDTYEGADPAQWLNRHGVAAFVLHYRVHPARYPAPIDDAKRAMRLIRSRAEAFGFAPDRLGIWGFSAGGHLAAVLSTLYDTGSLVSPDPVERLGDRPAFSILAYPVISMKPGITHPGSLLNLLGPAPDPALMALLSAEDHVTPQTPPTFVFTTSDDAVVTAENSLLYVAACHRAGVAVEFHMFEHGPHGSGLAETAPDLRVWPGLLAHWMGEHGWMAGEAQR